jgi:YfiH family protein
MDVKPEALALPRLLKPCWTSPPGVDAAMSLRGGGVSVAPFDSLNLSKGVGDDDRVVDENRRRWQQALGVPYVWLRQVHGADVLRLRAEHLHLPTSSLPTADAAWTTERGLACHVGAADCMPVLFALHDGSAVAAAHAGWRGLATGVLESTVLALCQGTGSRPSDVQAWLGPCIGPRQFEVGADVLAAFGQTPDTQDIDRFVYRARADGRPAWLANLPRLAQDRLVSVGVTDISNEAACTVEEPSRFFSFRRDRITGRMAAAIWRL